MVQSAKARGIEAEMRKRLSQLRCDSSATNCSGKPDPAKQTAKQTVGLQRLRPRGSAQQEADGEEKLSSYNPSPITHHPSPPVPCSPFPVPYSSPSPHRPKVIYLSPSGKLFNQAAASRLAREEELVLICGRYEGIDQRIIDLYVDEEFSVGDYVLSSGEVAALALIDTVYRLVDVVIKSDSLSEESFTGGLLEYPQWTRPPQSANMVVPDVLMSGHHENIRKWRLEKRVEKTLANRPDLIENGIAAGIFDAETLKLIKVAAEGRIGEL
jgi:tRNA G37 N-methylase TrmD